MTLLVHSLVIIVDIYLSVQFCANICMSVQLDKDLKLIPANISLQAS